MVVLLNGQCFDPVVVQPLRVDAVDKCPLCHHLIESIVFGQGLVQVGGSPRNPNELQGVQAVFRCPRPACSRLFIVRYGRTETSPYNASNPQCWKLLDTEPRAHVGRSFDEKLGNLSPQFVAIYGQAAAAESANLDQLCGPGYRKALEFLIKDYVKSLPENAGKEPAIEAAQLAQCISDFVKDENVKSCARRATWLGNDETHYVKNGKAKTSAT